MTASRGSQPPHLRLSAIEESPRTAPGIPGLLPPIIETRRLPRLSVVNRTDFILDRCKDKEVLHLGAVDRSGEEIGGLHRMLLDVAEDVIGIDNDIAGIALARERGIPGILEGDVEDLDRFPLSGVRPDVILATEIIEHLANPGKFLDSVKRFFSPHTEMIVTTPNCFTAYRFLYPILATEVIHGEHLSYHSFSTLTNLLSRMGYRILERYGYLLASRPMKLMEGLLGLLPHFAQGYAFVVTTP